jgi:putative DNA primase/helicase
MGKVATVTPLHQIREALPFIPPDDRETWVRVGMAVKRELGDEGFDIWDEWSRLSESYVERDARDVWKSFRADGPVTIATLLYEAKKRGLSKGSTPASARGFARVSARPDAKATDNHTGRYALQLWSAANRDDSVVAAHPYCRRKNVTHAFGARRGVASGSQIGRDADCILIPIRQNGIDEPIAVQAVNSDGRKQSFGTVGDGYLLLGDERDLKSPWVCCEGWATAHAVRKAVRRSIALVVFGKGRQRKVAELAAAHYQPEQIIISAESDE